MSLFVFRNNTVELLFPRGYTFSGYDDISAIPETVEGYVWFYQLPVKVDEALLCKEIEGYAEKVSWVLDRVGYAKPVYLLTMDHSFSIPMSSGVTVNETVLAYNTSLLDAQKMRPNTYVFDINEFTRQYSETDLVDWKFWFISQMGMNPRLSKSFMEWFKRKMNQVSLKRKKCLVVDLDNTLWGGILGEEGIGGIKVGGDYPGKAFLLFQEVLKQLGHYGIILAICSKNNEEEALDAIENNPFMVLRKDDFSCWRINWVDKATNIQEIANELNIGLDSVVFVDDNPTERELVRQLLPMVAVPEFPTQAYDLPLFCKDLVENYFRVYTVTEEDKKKTAQYKANALRMQSQRSFADFETFLKSLDIHIRVEPANEFNIPRIAQMTQKTNQFNLTTKRYTESDIQSRMDAGWEIYCMRASDRFGDSGITGCMMIHENEIDTFLLSCRILGKGIEQVFLKTVLAIMKQKGVLTIKARFIPSMKNVQVADFYDNCGFKIVGHGNNGEKIYSMDLEAADLSVKPYYSITV